MSGVSDVAAQNLDLARLQPFRAGDQPHERGLADPVRSDNTHQPPGWDVQIDRFKGDRSALAVRDPFDR
jgi:hypothetical protein